MQLKGTIY